MSIGITQVDEVGTFRQVDTAMPKGETSGHIQAVGKHRHLVRFAVLILVLENEQFVRRWFAGLQLRVGPSAKDP